MRTNVANTGKAPPGPPDRGSARACQAGQEAAIAWNDDEAANFAYVKHFLMDDFRLMGQQFGLEYAEAFRYIGPPPNYRDNIRKYVDEHAAPL